MDHTASAWYHTAPHQYYRPTSVPAATPVLAHTHTSAHPYEQSLTVPRSHRTRYQRIARGTKLALRSSSASERLSRA
eukprot:1651167-Rhodomonas_salina.1